MIKKGSRGWRLEQQSIMEAEDDKPIAGKMSTDDDEKTMLN